MANNYVRNQALLKANLEAKYQANGGTDSGVNWRYNPDAYRSGKSVAAHAIGVNVVADENVQAFFEDLNMRSGGAWSFDVNSGSNGSFLPKDRTAQEVGIDSGRFAAIHRGYGTPHIDNDTKTRAELLQTKAQYDTAIDALDELALSPSEYAREQKMIVKKQP